MKFLLLVLTLTLSNCGNTFYEKPFNYMSSDSFVGTWFLFSKYTVGANDRVLYSGSAPGSQVLLTSNNVVKALISPGLNFSSFSTYGSFNGTNVYQFTLDSQQETGIYPISYLADYGDVNSPFSLTVSSDLLIRYLPTTFTSDTDTNNTLYSFADASNGFSLQNSPVRFYTTSNGGESWSEIINHDLSITEAVCAVYTLDSSTVFLFTSSGIYKSTDFGSTWVNKLSLANACNIVKLTNKLSYKFNFYDTTSGVFFYDSAFYTTTDAGETWSLTDTSTYQEYYYISATDIIRVGTDGIKKSTDSGSSFTLVSGYFDLDNKGYFYFLNTTTGWGVNTNGNIFKSTDGGSNWSQLGTIPRFSSDRNVRGIYFKDESTGYIIDSQIGIYKSTDSGSTWFLYTGNKTSDLGASRGKSSTFSYALEQEFTDLPIGFVQIQ
ncbi:MAG: hypothetical protein AAF518_02220 [Spirochaetota bacterium]